MNYRHAFHAGNHADVLKHIVQLALIDSFKRKDSPFFVLDTHGGAGRYLLASEESRKTLEVESGVMRLMAQPKLPEVVERYLKAVQADNPVGAMIAYPGSPLLSAQAMRPQDRMAVCELQEDEAASLKTLFAHDSRVGVHPGDGYALLRSLLPPKSNGAKIGRGLVLIAPPYEAQDAEYQAILAALAAGHLCGLVPDQAAPHHPAFPAQGHRTAGEVGDDHRVPGPPGRLPAAPQRQRHAGAQRALAVRPGGRPGPAGAAPAPGRTGCHDPPGLAEDGRIRAFTRLYNREPFVHGIQPR